jgi:hypothetical protein
MQLSCIQVLDDCVVHWKKIIKIEVVGVLGPGGDADIFLGGGKKPARYCEKG